MCVTVCRVFSSVHSHSHLVACAAIDDTLHLKVHQVCESEWQQVVREFWQISDTGLDESVKTATLIAEAPPQLQEHLRLRSQEIGIDCKKVIRPSRVTCARRSHGILEAQLTWILAQSTKEKASQKARAKVKAMVTGAKTSPKGKTTAEDSSFVANLDTSQKIVITASESTEQLLSQHTPVCNYRTWTLFESCVQSNSRHLWKTRKVPRTHSRHSQLL